MSEGYTPPFSEGRPYPKKLLAHRFECETRNPGAILDSESYGVCPPCTCGAETPLSETGNSGTVTHPTKKESN